MQSLRVIRLLLAALLLPLATFSTTAQDPASAGTYNSEAAALMQQAQEWDTAGNSSRAIASYRSLVKNYPLAPTAPAAQFRLGELYDSLGNSKRSFDSYQKFLEKYPQSRDFDRAIGAQVAIADGLMENRRYEQAAEMFKSIVGTAPYAGFAPEVQFKLGQAYESQKEFKKAVDAYQLVLDRYPNSRFAPNALYQIGYVQFTEAQGRSQDFSAAIDAKNTLDEFLMEYPNSELAPQARENLKQITGREATDLLSIAKFYDKKNNYRAAVVYYSDLVRRQPGSEDAKLANQRIEEIRALVGDDELRTGTEREETGARAAMRRRMQNQVQTSALSTYAGPPVSTVAPPEELPAPKPQLRTSATDVQPLPPPADLPPVEPELPPLE